MAGIEIGMQFFTLNILSPMLIFNIIQTHSSTAQNFQSHYNLQYPNYNHYGNSNGYVLQHQYNATEEPVYYTKQQSDALLKSAMKDAWDMYGPKDRTRADSTDGSGTHNYITIPEHNFQAMDSEWDHHVTAVPIPVRNRVILQPGVFNRLLSNYIDFEVNNHELADFLRKLAFGILVGTLIVGWVGLGLYVGFIPLNWWFFTGKKMEGKLFERRNDVLADITDRIFLALDSDWLKKLEERVQMGSDRKWIKTHVHCCILPDSQTKGMADCRVIRRERKLSPYKCLSDLLYSFQFGPSMETIDSSNEARTHNDNDM